MLTYDPTQPLYTITLTRSAPWPDAPVFVMRFDGATGLTISTDRHRLSADGRSLTVEDRGFGNVLSGLAFNRTATAIMGDVSETVSLAGAQEPVSSFAKCRVTPTV